MFYFQMLHCIIGVFLGKNNIKVRLINCDSFFSFRGAGIRTKVLKISNPCDEVWHRGGPSEFSAVRKKIFLSLFTLRLPSAYPPLTGDLWTEEGKKSNINLERLEIPPPPEAALRSQDTKWEDWWNVLCTDPLLFKNRDNQWYFWTLCGAQFEMSFFPLMREWSVVECYWMINVLEVFKHPWDIYVLATYIGNEQV